MPAHLVVDERRHIWVEGVHKLAGPLDDGDSHPQLPQVFRQLQADKAASRQYGGFWVVGADMLFDAEGVLHRPQGEHLSQPHAGQTGLGGPGPGGEDQLVIALLKALAGV